MTNENQKSPISRTFLFALFSVILLVLSAWVIWNDEFGLRPWKNYQKEYKSLKREMLQKEYKQAEMEFRRSGKARRLAELEKKVQETENAFRTGAVHQRYEKLINELAGISSTMSKNQKELQTLRGQYLETEYYFTKNQKPQDKKTMDLLQKRIDALDLEEKRLRTREVPLRKAIAAMTGDISLMRQEIASLRKSLLDKKEKIANNERAPIEIKQYLIQDIDVADRCESCHVGITGSKQVSDKHPYTKHPMGFVFLEHHDPSKFGCTFCHRGQGRATTTIEKAHGNVKHWDEPLLKGDMTQTSCLNCHGDIKNLRGAEKIAGSTELIKKYGCYSCHKIPGYEGMGDVGPELTNVGIKVNYSWAVKWLLDPKSYFETARMPKFFFSQDQAEAIADYLFSMSGTTRRDAGFAETPPDEKLVEQGKTLWSQARCNLCHTTGGRGGNHIKVYAPDLTKVGSKVNKQWLFNWIKNPNAYYPGTKMPRFRFTDQEITALVEYIASEYQDEDAELDYTQPAEIKAASIKKGKELIQQYGCYGCHKIQGMEMVQVAPSLKTQGVTFLRSDEMKEKIGTELSSIGSKPLDLLDFGKLKNKILNDRLSYIKQKLRDPRGFRLGLRMPNFGLNEKEVDELAQVLYGFTDSHVPVRYMVPSRQELDRMAGVSTYKFTGDFAKVISDLKCTNCHTIKGIGADYAPDISFAGSKLQESWIRSFLANPDVIRPLLQQMPNLGLSAGKSPTKVTMPKFNLGKQVVEDTNRSDVDVVLNYFQQELVTTDIPKDIPEIGEVSRDQQLVLGKKLYDDKGCVACHQIGQDGGAVGPNLTNVGNRLKPGFIFMHLKNPRRFKADIVEPNYGFNDRERVFLTNYLMTLKIGANK